MLLAIDKSWVLLQAVPFTFFFAGSVLYLCAYFGFAPEILTVKNALLGLVLTGIYLGGFGTAICVGLIAIIRLLISIKRYRLDFVKHVESNGLRELATSAVWLVVACIAWCWTRTLG